MHGAGVFAPLREFVGVLWELLLEVADGPRSFVEEDGTVGVLEAGKTVSGVLPLILWDVGFEDLGYNVPELLSERGVSECLSTPMD